jgi:hypothetical protein
VAVVALHPAVANSIINILYGGGVADVDSTLSTGPGYISGTLFFTQLSKHRIIEMLSAQDVVVMLLYKVQ